MGVHKAKFLMITQYLILGILLGISSGISIGSGIFGLLLLVLLIVSAINIRNRSDEAESE